MRMEIKAQINIKYLFTHQHIHSALVQTDKQTDKFRTADYLILLK